MFETRINEKEVKAVNTYIFWGTLIISISIWGFFGVVNFIGLHILNVYNLINKIAYMYMLLINCTCNKFLFFFLMF